MDKDTLQHFKELLNKRLKDLVNEAQETVSGMTAVKADSFPDPTDRASLETNRSYLFRLKDRSRKLAIKIEETLKKIDDGAFGICKSCGEEIDIKRLEARPVTNSCIECKKNEEAKEKTLGL